MVGVKDSEYALVSNTRYLETCTARAMWSHLDTREAKRETVQRGVVRSMEHVKEAANGYIEKLGIHVSCNGCELSSAAPLRFRNVNCPPAFPPAKTTCSSSVASIVRLIAS